MSVRHVPIGTVLRRRETAAAVDPETDYLMLGLLNRGRGLFVRGTVRGAQTKYPRLTPLQRGDLVFSKLFAWEGSVAIVDREGWVSSEFPTYEIDRTQVDERFLAHVVSWDGFVDQLTSLTSGLGERRQRVSPESFESALIPIPAIERQRDVAARLDKFGLLDSVARSSRREQLSDLRERCIRSAVGTTASVPLSSVLAEDTRAVPVARHVEYPIAGVLGGGRGAFARNSIRGSETSYSRMRELKAGQVVYSRLKAFEGAFAVVDESTSGRFVSPEFPGFDANPEIIEIEWLSHVMHSSQFRDQVGSRSKGIGARRERLAVSDFLSIHIPLPAIDAQRQTLQHLNALTRVAELEERRHALIATALTSARNEELVRLRAG